MEEDPQNQSDPNRPLTVSYWTPRNDVGADEGVLRVATILGAFFGFVSACIVEILAIGMAGPIFDIVIVGFCGASSFLCLHYYFSARASRRQLPAETSRQFTPYFIAGFMLGAGIAFFLGGICLALFAAH